MSKEYKSKKWRRGKTRAFKAWLNRGKEAVNFLRAVQLRRLSHLLPRGSTIVWEKTKLLEAHHEHHFRPLILRPRNVEENQRPQVPQRIRPADARVESLLRYPQPERWAGRSPWKNRRVVPWPDVVHAVQLHHSEWAAVQKAIRHEPREEDSVKPHVVWR